LIVEIDIVLCSAYRQQSMVGMKSRAKPTKTLRPDDRSETTLRPRAPNRRGSPEAIEKRRVARVFNDILGGRGASAHKLDGRTEKRRQRLLKELEAGCARGTRELKPLDLARSEGYMEFACLAEAAIAAEEFAHWAASESVEEYLSRWAISANWPVARNDKLAAYWAK